MTGESPATPRKIQGISAVLLPFGDDLQIDWPGFESHLQRTAAAGLVPAVNMDTGFVQHLTPPQRRQVLEHARRVLPDGDLVVGAFVDDRPGQAFSLPAYQQVLDVIQEFGGVPVIFQSFGLTSGSEQDILNRYQLLSEHCQHWIAFELGQMFAPFGMIYSLDLYRRLLEIPQCRGLKHSSFDRDQEFQRLQIRDQLRPEFRLYTGNDLAIDMIMYGSDYLLGLSTMFPAAFARRDELWRTGHSGFQALNQALQELGDFTFRTPVPAYKHSAAMVLKLMGWIENDAPLSPRLARPAADRSTLQRLLRKIESALLES